MTAPSREEVAYLALLAGALGGAALRFCLEPGRVEEFERHLRSDGETTGRLAPPPELENLMMAAGSWLNRLAVQAGHVIAGAEPDGEVAWAIREADFREEPGP